MKIIGISAFYHDSAVAFIENGEIKFAAQEERYSRIKHDSSFPFKSMAAGFHFLNWKEEEIEAYVYYDKPWLKFERIIETYYSVAPYGYKSFIKGLPHWMKEKIFLPNILKKNLPKNANIKYSNHHLSHAASCFYPSPFEEAAILTVDGVGEWTTASIGYGNENKINIIQEMNFPHSIGLLYSAFTQFCGFKVNSGEYKLMGLAPYGRKNHPEVAKYKEIIQKEICKIYDDGSLWLEQKYFSYTTGLEMINQQKWFELFKLKPRLAEEKLNQKYCDIALAIQEVTEEVMIKMAKTAKHLTNSKNLCLAGGVALNCVANTKIRREKIFDHIWIQPAAGDAGGALGAALAYYHSKSNKLVEKKNIDQMKGAYLGSSYSVNQIKEELTFYKINYKHFNNEDLYKNAAALLADGRVLGLFQGRMEFGPRALGARSILADPRSEIMQKKLNLKIKYRESFRPFAPSVIEEDLHLFTDGEISPYMLFIDNVSDKYCEQLPDDFENWELEKKLYFLKSKLPAVTHLDMTARIQSVHENTNSFYYNLIKQFKNISGYGVVVNTSFNVRGEPIVCHPIDAIKCFFQTEMDDLILENFIISKENQTEEVKKYFKSLKTAFAMD